jgi:hypothetical protein
MVTLADIVRNQIRIAEGEPLNYNQDELLIVGHAIECRINAENPETFAPSPGTITAFNLPGGPGVRVDTFVYSGYRVTPFYDSLIGEADRARAHARARELRDEARARCDGGRGDQDDDSAAPEDHGRPAFPGWGHRHGFHGVLLSPKRQEGGGIVLDRITGFAGLTRKSCKS